MGLVIYGLVYNLGCFSNGHDLGIGLLVFKGHINIKTNVQSQRRLTSISFL